MIIRYTAAVGISAAFSVYKNRTAHRGVQKICDLIGFTGCAEERKNMKNKEFKKGIAIGVAATLVVTGAVFTSYQKYCFRKAMRFPM